MLRNSNTYTKIVISSFVSMSGEPSVLGVEGEQGKVVQRGGDVAGFIKRHTEELKMLLYKRCSSSTKEQTLTSFLSKEVEISEQIWKIKRNVRAE